MKRHSSLTFKDILDSKFGAYIKVVWNGDTIYNDDIDGLYIEHKFIDDLRKNKSTIESFEKKYANKSVYNFYCRIVEFHHTELYIEGEK